MARRWLLPLAFLVTACSGGTAVDRTSASLDDTAAGAEASTTAPSRARTPGEQRELNDIVERLLSEDSNLHPTITAAEATCIAERLTDEVGDDLADALADVAVGEEPAELVRRRDSEAAATIVASCLDYRAGLEASFGRDLRFPLGIVSCISDELTDDDVYDILVTEWTPDDDDDGEALGMILDAFDACAGPEADAILARSFSQSALDEGFVEEQEAACLGRHMVDAWRRDRAGFGDGVAPAIKALVDCVDLRDVMINGLVENGMVRPTAECVVARLSADDLRTFFRMQAEEVPLDEVTVAEGHAAAARAACGIGA
jgi:hypothetical protein